LAFINIPGWVYLNISPSYKIAKKL